MQLLGTFYSINVNLSHMLIEYMRRSLTNKTNISDLEKRDKKIYYS